MSSHTNSLSLHHFISRRRKPSHLGRQQAFHRGKRTKLEEKLIPRELSQHSSWVLTEQVPMHAGNILRCGHIEIGTMKRALSQSCYKVEVQLLKAVGPKVSWDPSWKGGAKRVQLLNIFRLRGCTRTFNYHTKDLSELPSTGKFFEI